MLNPLGMFDAREESLLHEKVVDYLRLLLVRRLVNLADFREF